MNEEEEERGREWKKRNLLNKGRKGIDIKRYHRKLRLPQAFAALQCLE